LVVSLALIFVTDQSESKTSILLACDNDFGVGDVVEEIPVIRVVFFCVIYFLVLGCCVGFVDLAEKELVFVVLGVEADVDRTVLHIDLEFHTFLCVNS